ALLNPVGYTSEISHGMLVEMAKHRKELEKKTKPILDTLRNYQDLPSDKALAALAIEDKKRQYAATEKYLEEFVIHGRMVARLRHLDRKVKSIEEDERCVIPMGREAPSLPVIRQSVIWWQGS
ncbi:hypothetical protein Dimus_032313, partial [Dionaea muscipula]